MAAKAAGVRTVLLPARNERDLTEIPSDVRKKMKFVTLERVDEALDEALGR